MPAPQENEIPDKDRWKPIVRRNIQDSELLALARNVVKYDGQDHAPIHGDILDFLEESVEQRNQRWSDYWVSFIQGLGLGYISSSDPKLHATQLAQYVATSSHPIDPFYLYWFLMFQYPWADSKHAEWKAAKKVVQPYVTLLDHLLYIFELERQSGNWTLEQVYLAYDEIVLIIMPSRIDTFYDVMRNVNQIRSNRAANLDYVEAKRVKGFDTVKEQLADRLSGYWSRLNILRFDGVSEQIRFRDFQGLFQGITLLEYRRDPVVIEDQKTRLEYFEKVYMELQPHPDHLYRAVSSVTTPNVTSLEGHHIDIIVRNLGQRGLLFPEGFVESFLLSLQSKPFVILSGISGTGKTLLPRAIMQMLGNGKDLSPVAVAPDWTDNSDILGYFDMNGSFQIGEFTTLVNLATQHPETPYFIILDEMNLARVEYYFAHVLSAMESRQYNSTTNKSEYTDYLFNKAIRQRLLITRPELAELKLPDNVFIVGTVNIDETTYPFSKKVLDRANVLEINDVDLFAGVTNNYATYLPQYVPPFNYLFAGRISNMQELRAAWSLNPELSTVVPEQTLNLWIEELQKFSDVLKPLGMHFGLRVRDEVAIYLYYAALRNAAGIGSNTTWWHVYFDQQLVQKVLTRLGGEQGQIESYLVRLFQLCLNVVAPLSEAQISALELQVPNQNQNALVKFPKAATKLQRMLKDITVGDRPSTSFWMA